MIHGWIKSLRRYGACGLLLATTPVLAAEPAAGVVRISKPSANVVTVRAQSETVVQAAPVPNGAVTSGNVVYSDCPNGDCYGDGYGYGGKWGHRGYYGDGGYSMMQYLRCKFGYFIPTGNGGAGSQFAGRYARVYPQDPSYFDQRDGQLWAAQGYGVPVAVPLAPVVGHQYNYSWGVPSSRLTPISRLAPQ
ncbi:MAG TPA: hypothetical protein VFG20_01985 [Planctomycetaceae bacterium]|nr:hypothetical protein [Planctomycetaceae bacterium]